ncbi:hypothetical protein [Yersinia pestis]|nr:hypothetical protein [Yersinia pestis]EFA48286.1 conserved domain protein [Yersinia pestis KIM D27]ABG15939.1 putative membrane protein [Yersinia pestis Antiqua]ABG19690.1 membrane protein [Yersinia pestis Nepal516]ABP42016.1 membrane protein [Yersinia pestis Pestoides F]AEL71397.1 hypothetical protein A1122_03610 [Yersinia pestis A1122]
MWGDHLYTEGGIFFPVVEIDMPQEFAGSARAIGYLIGYLPSLFGYRLYGYFLDTYLGIQGVNYVFYIMAAFSAGRFICAAVWAK